jgi:serpin B
MLRCTLTKVHQVTREQEELEFDAFPHEAQSGIEKMKEPKQTRARCLRILSAVLVYSVAFQVVLAADEDMPALASANTAFGFAMMKQVLRERSDANVFISPYSISAALQMLWQGAGGQTKKEMDQVLALSGLKIEAAGAAYNGLDKSIKAAGSNVVLNIANSIWYAPNIVLKPQFLSMNQNFYGAKLSALDFTDPRSAGVVNSWVSEATHGKIAKIVDPPLSSMTGAFLANAIYFKGTWEHKFDTSTTKEQPFHLRSGQQKQTSMMRQNRKFTYQENGAFQAVRLPYAGERLGMFVFLPSTNSNPEKILEAVNADNWQKEIIPKFEERDGTVVLPRFKLDFKADLIPALKAMGIRQAFTQAADFSGISETEMFVSGVDHASFVEVNEEGTEAAAATGITMRMTAVRPTVKPFQMIVDRPFFFVIEDSLTHSILFMGIVNEPGATN